MSQDQKQRWRPVYIVSDGTAITAETLANSILTQFPELSCERHRVPFVRTSETVHAVIARIQKEQDETGARPLVFSTFVRPDIARLFVDSCPGFHVELFRAFIGPMEAELGMSSSHSVGASHKINDPERYSKRIAAIDYTLSHDDGQTNRGLDDADVILIGVSRSGKTPTSIYLAMQFGLRVANYPLIPEDFERGCLPPVLSESRSRLFGLSIDPERLSEVRNERRPGSRYASLENCREEILAAQRLMTENGISWLNSTSKSIEEIAATIISTLHLGRFVNV